MSDLIKLWREDIGLLQSDVADYVGVTVQTIWKWETGQTEPKASQVMKLCQILNKSVEDICGAFNGMSEDEMLAKRVSDAEIAFATKQYAKAFYKLFSDYKKAMEAIK